MIYLDLLYQSLKEIEKLFPLLNFSMAELSAKRFKGLQTVSRTISSAFQQTSKSKMFLGDMRVEAKKLEFGSLHRWLRSQSCKFHSKLPWSSLRVTHSRGRSGASTSGGLFIFCEGIPTSLGIEFLINSVIKMENLRARVPSAPEHRPHNASARCAAIKTTRESVKRVALFTCSVLMLKLL